MIHALFQTVIINNEADRGAALFSSGEPLAFALSAQAHVVHRAGFFWHLCKHTYTLLHTHTRTLTHTHTIITPIFNNVALEKLKQKEQCNWKRRFVIHPFFPFFFSFPFFFFFLHLQHTEMMTSLKYLIKKGKILQCEDIFACKESHQQSSSDILLRRQMLR